MMANLVDQHVPDDVSQRLVVFGPVIEDRPAVEPDHVGQPRDISMALMRQADAVEKPEQVEFAFRAHLVEDFVGRKIIDPYDHSLAEIAEVPRQAGEDVVRHGLHFGEGGRFC